MNHSAEEIARFDQEFPNLSAWLATQRKELAAGSPAAKQSLPAVPQCPPRLRGESSSTPSPWHTITTAAQTVNLSPNAIRSYIQQGLLPASRMPSTRKNNQGNPGRGDIRIHHDDLLQFMHDCRIQPNSHTPDPHNETTSQMLQRIMETHPV